jgi:hypothetical protein
MNTRVIDQVVRQLESLPEDKQRRVLEFAQSLGATAPGGVPGDQLLRFAGSISPDQLELMSEAIENGCEQVGGQIR